MKVLVFGLLFIYSSFAFSVSLESLAKKREIIDIEPVTLNGHSVAAVSMSSPSVNLSQTQNIAARVCFYAGFSHLESYVTKNEPYSIGSELLNNFEVYSTNPSALPLTILKLTKAFYYEYWKSHNSTMMVLKSVKCSKP